LKNLENEKNSKLRYLPKKGGILDEYRVKIIRDRLEIMYYYLIAKHDLTPKKDRKPIDWSELKLALKPDK
jgi:hypothetical protein